MNGIGKGFMETIDNDIYDRIPTTWWTDEGFMALLRNSVNPPRFAYFRDVLVKQARLNPSQLSVLDVGCGGGLLSEQFAAIGCAVTGVDRSTPTLAEANAHATVASLAITYLEADALCLPFEAGRFDVVCCCDVLEHVDDVDKAVAEISRVLKPGGIFFFDTINRTLRSKLLAIKIAQDWKWTCFVPRNVHVWHKFIRPDELAASMSKHALSPREFFGLSPTGNPLRMLAAFVRLKLGKMSFAELGNKITLAKSRDLSVSYMGYAVRD